jgi:iron complex transport system permease protein
VSLPVAASCGSLGATALLFLVAGRGRATPTELLLAGIGVNALCGAGVGLAVFAADDVALRSFTFWSLGSLGSASWPVVGVTAVGALLPALAATGLAARLDVLGLGDSAAHAAGVDLPTTRWGVVALCAAAVGTSVAQCGTISFVGLVAPHVVRLTVGPSHRGVLLGSLLGGAALLLAADLLARTAVAPVELPVGVVTTALGGPFLLWLLQRRRG